MLPTKKGNASVESETLNDHGITESLSVDGKVDPTPYSNRFQVPVILLKLPVTRRKGSESDAQILKYDTNLSTVRTGMDLIQIHQH